MTCVMCGGTGEMAIGSRWLCRPDAERLAWHLAEFAAVAQLCGLTFVELHGELTR